jgi:hypothetical protein
MESFKILLILELRHSQEEIMAGLSLKKLKLYIAYIAKIIRQDDGSGEQAAQFKGLPYRQVFLSRPGQVLSEQELSRPFRFKLDSVSNERHCHAEYSNVTFSKRKNGMLLAIAHYQNHNVL